MQRTRKGFPFELLADPDGVACKLYNVIQPKIMYGKTVQGIERSTLLIDPEGILRREWRKLKVEGHVAEVLQALRSQGGISSVYLSIDALPTFKSVDPLPIFTRFEQQAQPSHYAILISLSRSG